MNEENILKQAGLSEEQAITYEALLDKGPQKASTLTNWTGINRSLTYKVLDQLENMGLVEKKDSMGAVSIFSPSHPSVLLDKIERDKKNLELAKEVVSLGLGNLSSKFNLLSGKPNIRFFEGEEGVKKVLEDTLKTKGEVLTYLDIEIVEKYFKKINDNYILKRKKLGIKKRILVIENTFSKNLFTKWQKEDPKYFENTNLKMIKTPIEKIEGAIQIYENKIGIITISNDNLISIIIEDKRINKLFKSIFEALYLTSPSFTP